MINYLLAVLPAKYAKLLMSVAGSAVMVLTYYYGSAKWFPAVIGALTAAGVAGVPNKTPASPPAPSQASSPAIPPAAAPYVPRPNVTVVPAPPPPPAPGA